MPLILIDEDSTDSASGNTASISGLSGISLGNLILSTVHRTNNAGAPTARPSGFTTLIERNSGMGVNYAFFGLYAKIADASDVSGDTYGITFAGSTRMSFIVSVWGGAIIPNVGGLQYSNTLYVVNDPSIIAYGLTSAVKAFVLSIATGYATAGVTFTRPTGFTSRLNAGNTSSDLYTLYATRDIDAGALESAPNAVSFLSVNSTAKHGVLLLVPQKSAGIPFMQVRQFI